MDLKVKLHILYKNKTCIYQFSLLELSKTVTLKKNEHTITTEKVPGETNGNYN